MNDTKDVSVLLNLTGNLAIERANPLMDLVSGGGPFLFYDRLSLERFPLNQEEQDSFVWKQLTNLRNLLVSRQLSSDDQGGTIRIIVTLDLVDGFAHGKEHSCFFPAQKVRRFREMIQDTFKNEKQLLSRLHYIFIFIEWGEEKAGFYRTLAYSGCLGQEEWLTSDILEINKYKPKGRNLDVDSTLDDTRIKKECAEFWEKLNTQKENIAAVLSKAGVDIGEKFKEQFSKVLSGLRTYGDLRDFNFDEQLKATISAIIGLSSPEFSDCSFFIFKMRKDATYNQEKDEMVLFSLLQLLATIKRSAWTWRGLSLVDGSMNEHSLNAEALLQLKGEVSAFHSMMKEDGKLRLAYTEEVECRVFTARNTSPTDNNVHHKYNEETDDRRNELYDKFLHKRSIPFFFGTSPTDWKWFSEVSDILDEIYAYEMEHDHPRYASPGRITEKEMETSTKTISYADMEEKVKKLEQLLSEKDCGTDSAAGGNKGNLLTDLAEYMQQWEGIMTRFAKYKEELKKQMTKLGFASVTFILSSLVCLLVTLCYAFHFIYTGNSASMLWIPACLVLACIICGLAAKMSQLHIKSAIKIQYSKIDECREQINKQKESYINKINSRTLLQNKADILRKNLEEMQEKLNEFKSHNRKADLWENHFKGLEEKLSKMLEHARHDGTSPHGRENAAKTVANDLQLDEMPCLPESTRAKFRSMEVCLSPGGAVLKDVTCFLRELYANNMDMN